MTEEQSIQDEMGQVIANSFFGMEAGYMPTEPHELPTPSSGDLQLAFDVLTSPVIRRIQAEAIREAVRIFAEGEWVDTFIVESVQDDVSAVVATDKWFNEYADDIEAGDD